MLVRLVAVWVWNTAAAVTAIVCVIIRHIAGPAGLTHARIVAGLACFTAINALAWPAAVWVHRTTVAVTAIVGIVVAWIARPHRLA